MIDISASFDVVTEYMVLCGTNEKDMESYLISVVSWKVDTYFF